MEMLKLLLFTSEVLDVQRSHPEKSWKGVVVVVVFFGGEKNPIRPFLFRPALCSVMHHVDFAAYR